MTNIGKPRRIIIVEPIKRKEEIPIKVPEKKKVKVK